ncbi:MAG: polyprenyl synthetase family protein [Gemmatimonadaceae bacterium]|nr:polyprenyl synthetase family protein [Gemmatimonadaceae bacterium]
MTLKTRNAASPSLKDIQAPVAGALARVHEEMWRIVAVDSEFFRGVNQHLMLMKGKMVRPTLMLLSSETAGAAEPRVASYAAVIELIHLATLVHDDAVDHSALRRGMPTVNALFTHEVAVIAGDFLYSRAVQELVRLGDLEALRVFANASNELTVGEMRQLGALNALAFSEADYEFLIKCKTAALFKASCEVGALCGAPDHRQALSTFGERLGMAFQVADDLLDYTAVAATTGKPTGLDLKEHKVTLPLIHALRSISPAGLRVVEALFANPDPTGDQIAAVVEVVQEAGGLDYARIRGEEFLGQAEEALTSLPDTPARQALHDAMVYVMERSS